MNNENIKNCGICKAVCVQAGHQATRTNCPDYTDGKAPKTEDSSGSTELPCCAAIGDFVTVRMSRGAYRLKMTTQEQVDIVNNELLTQSGWGLIKSPN